LPTAGQLNNFCPQVRSLPQLCRSTTVKWLLECHSFQRGVSKFVLFSFKKWTVKFHSRGRVSVTIQLSSLGWQKVRLQTLSKSSVLLCQNFSHVSYEVGTQHFALLFLYIAYYMVDFLLIFRKCTGLWIMYRIQ